jgi:hypothetical protein
MSDTPCPIQTLVDHSAEHFSDPAPMPVNSDWCAVAPFEVPKPPAPETFEQLAQRRIRNLRLMDRMLITLAERAPTEEALDAVLEASMLLNKAVSKLNRCKGGE